MTLYQFGSWRPDQNPYNDPTAAGEAKGVLIGGNGYLPWPQLTAITDAALGAPARGAFLARATDGTLKLFVGTETGLFRLTATSWTDVTRGAGVYSVPSDDQWSFDQFGTDLVAVNQGDEPQVIDVDVGTEFAALGGSPPVAGGVRTVGAQLFLYRLVDNPSRLAWSGRGDHEFWTYGSRDCDKQDFQDGGAVTGLSGLETGLVFQEGATRRMTPVASRAVFRFDRLENDRGMIAPGSLVVVGNVAFYYSEEGFMATDGTGASQRIGVNMVDEWFQQNANMERLYTVVGAADPVSHHVYFLFPSTGVTSYVKDHALCYDIMLKSWTHAEVSASHIFGGASVGYDMDVGLPALLTSLGLTLDTATFSLDSRWLQGGAPVLAAIDSANKLAFFAGTPMAHVLETADFQPIVGRRSYVRGITPITDNAAAKVRLGTKEAISSSLSYNTAQTINARGFVAPLKSGRVFRVRVTGEAGDTWSHQRGVEVDAIDDGEI